MSVVCYYYICYHKKKQKYFIVLYMLMIYSFQEEMLQYNRIKLKCYNVLSYHHTESLEDFI